MGKPYIRKSIPFNINLLCYKVSLSIQRMCTVGLGKTPSPHPTLEKKKETLITIPTCIILLNYIFLIRKCLIRSTVV